MREAGKTFSNAIAEVREAVDFLHYYAGRCATISIMKLTARWVRWSVSARGTSRWRSSPARLPPRWRPATACWRNLPSRRRLSPPEGVAILLEAGVPPGVIQLLPGRGETVGAALTSDEARARRDVHRLHRSGHPAAAQYRQPPRSPRAARRR